MQSTPRGPIRRWSETATRNRERKTIAIAVASNARGATLNHGQSPSTVTLSVTLLGHSGERVCKSLALTNGGFCILYSRGLSSKSFQSLPWQGLGAVLGEQAARPDLFDLSFLVDSAISLVMPPCD